MKRASNSPIKRKKLAIWAGAGVLPYHAAMQASRITQVIIIAFQECSDIDLLKKTGLPLHVISLGEMGKNFALLKKEKVDHLVMLGKFDKSFLLGKTKFDLGALGLLIKLANLRDMSIFNALAQKLEAKGIEVVSQLLYLPNQTAKPGCLTKKRPSRQEMEDARYGMKTAKMMADLDIGQTVVVRRGTVIAVETVLGTDATILGIPAEHAKGALMAKTTRTKQDPRFDIATVGLTTIHNLKKKNINTLAVEKNKTILVDKETLIREANKTGMCIISL